MSNDTVMIRFQKDTYGRDFNLESEETQMPPSTYSLPGGNTAYGVQSIEDDLPISGNNLQISEIRLHWMIFQHR